MPHIERHFTGGQVVRDIVMGMADGLTVPFALAAGLSGAVNSSTIVVTAGLAEIAAGMIAMGLGGYLAARSDIDHYKSERRREQREVRAEPEEEATEVAQILEPYGLGTEESALVIRAMRKQPERWVDFMMRMELGLERPSAGRAPLSALLIGGAYLVGGLIPLSPYFLVSHVHRALMFSVAVTLVALAAFGAFKGQFTDSKPLRSAIQTLLIGGLAASAAFLIARLVS